MGLEDSEQQPKDLDPGDLDAVWQEETQTYKRPRSARSTVHERSLGVRSARDRSVRTQSVPTQSVHTQPVPAHTVQQAQAIQDEFERRLGARVRQSHPPRSQRVTDITGAAVRGEATLVIVESGAAWPRWLATELAGEKDALILAQQAEEHFQAFVGRVTGRLRRYSRSVSSVLWLVPDRQRSIAASEFSRWICEQLSITCDVRRVMTGPVKTQGTFARASIPSESGEISTAPGIGRAVSER